MLFYSTSMMQKIFLYLLNSLMIILFIHTESSLSTPASTFCRGCPVSKSCWGGSLHKLWTLQQPRWSRWPIRNLDVRRPTKCAGLDVWHQWRVCTTQLAPTPTKRPPRGPTSRSGESTSHCPCWTAATGKHLSYPYLIHTFDTQDKK